MKTLLLPIDFSVPCKNAQTYALHMAEEMQAKVHLLHVINRNQETGDLPNYEAGGPDTILPTSERKEQAIEKLEQLRLEILAQEWKITEITCEVTMGLPEDEIVYASNRSRPDLIIMGTRGASKVYKTFPGSVTAFVIERANCPVLALPADAVYQGLTHILYASHFDQADYHSLGLLFQMLSPLSRQIDILHLYRKSADLQPEVKHNLQHKLYQHISQRFPAVDFHVDVISGHSLNQMLKDYIQQRDIQLVITTTHKRNAITRQVDPSFTRNLLYELHMPLLAFHSLVAKNHLTENFRMEL